MNTKTRFDGRHWETGSIQNALAIQDIKAPHTGEPYSEALLLGVSGGIAFGYFTFEYKGYLPQVALLTRNTFNPFPTILERLGIAQDVRQTGKADVAETNLVGTLESGLHPLVWADHYSLPYNGLEPGKSTWAMMPILALETDGKSVSVADRASRPLKVTMDELTEARGRVKEDKYRLMTLDAPQPAKLAAAIQKGIWQTISLFTEDPTRGSRKNFGFAGYDRLATLLVNTRNKSGWERYFGPGVRMYHALAGSPVQPGMYHWVMTWGSADGAERGLYADFLGEAAEILNKPALKKPAAKFRECHALWIEFAKALLPDDVALLGESRKLIQEKHDLFITRGASALPEIRKIHARHNELLAEAGTNFPLSGGELADFRANLRDILVRIRDSEQTAVDLLQAAVV